ncbi:aspartate kinase [Candidatus Woesearchaeota archaeon]|nr:aspartate kinase [Candidatus Woesearchaeota archaeon]
MIVMKFGGTSIGTAERIRNAVRIVKERKGKKPVVVVSALSKVTNSLLKAAEDSLHKKNGVDAIRERHYEIMKELGLSRELIEPELNELAELLTGINYIKELTPRTIDYVTSFGERLSSKIFAAYARKAGLKASAHCTYDLGFITDSQFGDASTLPETYPSLRKSIKKLAKKEIPIITGFIAKDRNGSITTIGRGGSDLTASIIGIAVGAEEIQIWTDVDGMLTADPRVVRKARTVPIISFDEASELAYFGAKVLHPKSILPAMEKDIPVRVLNTMNPENRGTEILRHTKHSNRITSIACKKGISVINIHSARMLLAHGFLHKIFRVFDQHSVSVDMIATSEVNVSITVSGKADIEMAIRELRHFADVKVEKSKASICVVGAGLKRIPGMAATVFGALGKEKINVEMTSQGASEINVGFVVNEDDADRAIRSLHSELIEKDGGVFK